MSYILDALKKMEHEKARKANPAGMTKISGDLFREDRSRSVQSGVWRLVAVAVIASLVAIAATWFFLAPSRRNAHVAPRAAVSPEQDMSAVPRALPAAPPVAPRPPVRPVAQPQPAPLVLPPQEIQSQASQAGQPPGVKTFKPSSRTELARQRKEPKGPATERAAPVTMVAPPTDIKIDGIAWQDDRKARRAVINGLLLKEGSVVSGARVSEIRKNRVRFSQSGRNFEVTMTAPGSSGASGTSAPAPASVPSPAPNFSPAPGNGIGR